jgi:hypothetical protein
METKKITLDNIQNEDIIQMAKYIQNLEQMNKDQYGYILQLQTQLKNAGKKLKEFHQYYSQQENNSYTVFTPIEED